MKITSKKIKECEYKWAKTMVLDLDYTYKWETWKILIKDYDDNNFKEILKALRVQIRNNYNLTKNIWV